MKRLGFVLSMLLAAGGPAPGDADSAATPPPLPAELFALRDARVVAEVSGRVVTRPEDETSAVSAGDVVVAIDDTLYASAARGARGDRELARARLDWAGLEAERMRALVDKGTVGQAEYDRAAIALREATAVLESATARLSEAETRLERTRIRAPFAGRLVRVPKEAGEFLSAGELAFRIIDDSALRVVAYLPSALLGRVEVAAEIRLEAPPEEPGPPPILATVFSIAPVAEGRARTFRMEARVSGADRAWRPGMTALLRLRIEKQD